MSQIRSEKLEKRFTQLCMNLTAMTRLACWDIPFARQREMMALIQEIAQTRINELVGAEDNLHNGWRKSG